MRIYYFSLIFYYYLMLDTKDQEAIKNAILDIVGKKGEIDTEELSKELKVDRQIIVGACKSLEIKEIIALEQKEIKEVVLTEDGRNILEKGSPDLQLFKELKANGAQTKKALQDKLGKTICDRGFSLGMKAKAIAYDKKTDIVSLKIDTIPTSDTYHDQLDKFVKDNKPESYAEKVLNDYKKIHKMITIEVLKYYKVTKGKNFEVGNVKFETELTSDLLASGAWEKTKFKKYNYNALGKELSNGALHPLLNVRKQIRDIFLEQGFQEMPTNNFVESSFWNFDSLFQPQQHPTRDAHDTFFLSNPSRAHTEKILPEYFNKVKEVHEVGGYGSIGWQYKWNPDEAEKNILRTHTTAVSSRMLHLLAEEYKKTGVYTKKKYFSIDRVFRNETLDNTHLCEFHQIEGFIVDKNLGLGHLLGTIQDFFTRFGINKLRFKPAYNPYTEPSCELYAYHDVSKKWVEIGNSGVFRPEMLKPMGLPDDVSVIAWGFSLERPTMIHYHLENIRELFGHEVNIKHTQDASLYYL